MGKKKLAVRGTFKVIGSIREEFERPVFVKNL